MADISWIKLKIDMFDDEKIKIIQSMPDGDAILVIWIRLIALAGKCNANGFILVDDEFPYSDEMLSIIFGKPLPTIRLALQTFKKFHMLETTQKGIYITNFEKHQNAEGMDRIREQNRLRKKREREQKKMLLLEESGQGKELCSGSDRNNGQDVSDSAMHGDCDESRDVTNLSRDMSRDVTQQRENKNKEKEIYNISSNEDIVGSRPTKPPEAGMERIIYGMIMDDYNCTCTDMPGIRAVSDARKRKIKTLLNELERLKLLSDLTPYDKLHKIFMMAQESDFLSGRNQKWHGCSFDWLINKANALKILEGNYKNKGGVRDGHSARDSSGHGNDRTGQPEVGRTTSDALERYRRNNGGANVQVSEVP